jgi:hypothetical protein
MSTIRRAKGGPFAQPYVSMGGHLVAFTGREGELISVWLIKALNHMKSHQYYYTVLAADLKDSKHLQGRALEQWQGLQQKVEQVWEDVLEPQVALDTSDVEAGVQQLENRILLYLVTFTDPATPTTTDEIQHAISTATMDPKNIGGTYDYYKNILHLLEQLEPGT